MTPRHWNSNIRAWGDIHKWHIFSCGATQNVCLFVCLSVLHFSMISLSKRPSLELLDSLLQEELLWCHYIGGHDLWLHDIWHHLYDVMPNDAMTYDVMTYDVMTYDVMTYDVMTYDVMTYDQTWKKLWIVLKRKIQSFTMSSK